MKSRTVYAVLEEAAAKFGERPALHQPGTGAYRVWTWRNYRDAVRQIAVGLHEIGVRKGDMVALQSETRAEFYLADIAIISLGAISAALYTSLSFFEQARALRGCDAKFAIVEHTKAMRGLQSALGDAPPDIGWILLTGAEEGARTLEEIRRLGERKLEESPGAFERVTADVKDSDTAILYMTSGATGEPKMGLVTHRAVVSNIAMGPAVLPLSPEDVTIAFLPSAHIAQRVVVEFLPIVQGAQVFFSESLAKLPH
jgi:long-chain acyl-CoA synthetase